MIEVIAVATGGAFGALARYWMAQLGAAFLGDDFPYGIFLVNAVGSLLIGVLFVLIVERELVSAVWRSALIVGFLGAFTTFSTFSLQTLGLLESGRLGTAAIYAFGSLVVCLAATAAGLFLTRLLP